MPGLVIWGSTPGLLACYRQALYQLNCILNPQDCLLCYSVLFFVVGNLRKDDPKCCSLLHPGHQFYHSLLCVVLQFLILRLMGRTVTAIFTTLCFQMVIPPSSSGHMDGRCGEGQGRGW